MKPEYTGSEEIDCKIIQLIQAPAGLLSAWYQDERPIETAPVLFLALCEVTLRSGARKETKKTEIRATFWEFGCFKIEDCSNHLGVFMPDQLDDAREKAKLWHKAGVKVFPNSVQEWQEAREKAELWHELELETKDPRLPDTSQA